MTMTTATAEATAGQVGRARYGSISRGRRRALFWSYFFLILFVIFFLTPPVYMFITSLKSSAKRDFSAAASSRHLAIGWSSRTLISPSLTDSDTRRCAVCRETYLFATDICDCAQNRQAGVRLAK